MGLEPSYRRKPGKAEERPCPGRWPVTLVAAAALMGCGGGRQTEADGSSPLAASAQALSAADVSSAATQRKAQAVTAASAVVLTTLSAKIDGQPLPLQSMAVPVGTHVELTASAAHLKGLRVTAMALYDGDLNIFSAGAFPPYEKTDLVRTFFPTNLTPGTHTFQLRVYDESSDIVPAAQSVPITITVFEEAGAPTVGIQTPKNGQQFDDLSTAPATAFSSAASASVGAVASLSYLYRAVDYLFTSPTQPSTGFAWFTSPSAPYSAGSIAKLQLPRSADGATRRIAYAVATDSHGKLGYSQPVMYVTRQDFPLTTSVAPGPYAAGTPVTLTADPRGWIPANSDPTLSLQVDHVEFYDGTTLVSTTTSRPYTTTWQSTKAGIHALTAVAYNRVGGKRTSTPQYFVIGPHTNASPTVSLTGPTVNSVVTYGTPVTLTATASDADGHVTHVEFLDGTTVIRSALEPPFALSWNGTAGAHRLSARAVDNNGAATTSASVSMTVASPTITASNQDPKLGVTSSVPSGSIVNVGDTVTLTANASDTDGKIVRVELRRREANPVYYLYSDIVIDQVLNAPPYKFTIPMSNASTRAFRYTVRAFDDKNGFTESDPFIYLTAAAGTKGSVSVNLIQPSTGLKATVNSAVKLRATTTSTGAANVTDVSFNVEPPTASVTGTCNSGAALSNCILSMTATVPGTYKISAVASGNGYLQANSEPVLLLVTDSAINTPPTVAMTAPVVGGTVTAGVSTQIKATASDTDGIDRIDFFDGTTLVGSSSTTPYAVSWTPSAGVHTLYAWAFDTRRGRTVSTPVTVTAGVAPPPPPPPTIDRPTDATSCGKEGGICTVPAGTLVTVYYGANGKYFTRTGVTGSIACNTTAFGDPIKGTAKACYYTITRPKGVGTGLLGTYYAHLELQGSPVLTRIEAVDFNWGQAAPAPSVPADGFSVRWTGMLEAPVTGAYSLRTLSDDGIRVWIDNKLVINNWTNHAATENTSGVFTMTAGERHAIKVEYQDAMRSAVAKLSWLPPKSATYAVVPKSYLYAN